jgi:hypothetical protein
MESYAETCSEFVVWINIHIRVILSETLCVEFFPLLGRYTTFICSFSSYRCPIWKGQVVHDCFILEDETDRLSRNSVNNYHSTLHNIPEELKSHLHCGGNLTSRIFRVIWIIKHEAEIYIYDDIRMHHRYIHFEVEKSNKNIINTTYWDRALDSYRIHPEQSSVGQLVQQAALCWCIIQSCRYNRLFWW